MKSCYEFTESQYKKLVKHTPTRWLTLCAAIERLIENLEYVKSYFIGINQEETPDIIVEFVGIEQKTEFLCSNYILNFHMNF